jgi:hypothetical protein
VYPLGTGVGSVTSRDTISYIPKRENNPPYILKKTLPWGNPFSSCSQSFKYIMLSGMLFETGIAGYLYILYT